MTLEIESSEEALATASLVSASGLVIDATLINAQLEKGINVFSLDISSLTPGFYTVRIKVGAKIIDKKLIVISN